MIRAFYEKGEPGLTVGDLRVERRLPEEAVVMVGAEKVEDHHPLNGGEIVCFTQSSERGEDSNG